MWATLEQPGVPTGVQKYEMCVFTAPAHKKESLQVRALSCVLT